MLPPPPLPSPLPPSSLLFHGEVSRRFMVGRLKVHALFPLCTLSSWFLACSILLEYSRHTPSFLLRGGSRRASWVSCGLLLAVIPANSALSRPISPLLLDVCVPICQTFLLCLIWHKLSSIFSIVIFAFAFGMETFQWSLPDHFLSPLQCLIQYSLWSAGIHNIWDIHWKDAISSLIWAPFVEVCTVITVQLEGILCLPRMLLHACMICFHLLPQTPHECQSSTLP